MTMPKTKKPEPPRPTADPGEDTMTPEEEEAFERSFKRHEETLRRLAKS